MGFSSSFSTFIKGNITHSNASYIFVDYYDPRYFQNVYCVLSASYFCEPLVYLENIMHEYVSMQMRISVLCLWRPALAVLYEEPETSAPFQLYELY